MRHGVTAIFVLVPRFFEKTFSTVCTQDNQGSLAADKRGSGPSVLLCSFALLTEYSCLIHCRWLEPTDQDIPKAFGLQPKSSAKAEGFQTQHNRQLKQTAMKFQKRSREQPRTTNQFIFQRPLRFSCQPTTVHRS